MYLVLDWVWPKEDVFERLSDNFLYKRKLSESLLSCCDFLNDSYFHVFYIDFILSKVVCLNFSLLFDCEFLVIIMLSSLLYEILSLFSI